MLNLQKKFYSSLQRESKQELVSFFGKLNIYTWDSSHGQLVVNLKDDQQKAKTPTVGWKCTTKEGTDKSSELPNDIIASRIDSLLDKEATQPQTLLQEDETVLDEISEDNNISGFPGGEGELLEIPDGFFDVENDVNADAVSTEENETSLQINVTNVTKETQENVAGNQAEGSSAQPSETRDASVTLEQNEWESLLKLLQVSKVGDKWKGKTVQYLKECCLSACTLNKQTDGSLSVILKYLKPKMKAIGLNVPVTIRKADKVILFRKLLATLPE